MKYRDSTRHTLKVNFFGRSISAYQWQGIFSILLSLGYDIQIMFAIAVLCCPTRMSRSPTLSGTNMGHSESPSPFSGWLTLSHASLIEVRSSGSDHWIHWSTRVYKSIYSSLEVYAWRWCGWRFLSVVTKVSSSNGYDLYFARATVLIWLKFHWGIIAGGSPSLMRWRVGRLFAADYA